MPLRRISSLGIFVVVSLLGFLPMRANTQEGNIREKILEVFYPYRRGARSCS